MADSDAPKHSVTTPVLHVDTDAQYAFEHQARCALVVSCIGSAIILSAICSRIDSPPLVIGLVLLFCGVLWSVFIFGYLADRAVVLTHALAVRPSVVSDQQQQQGICVLSAADRRLRNVYTAHVRRQMRDNTDATWARVKMELSLVALVLLAFTCSTSWLAAVMIVIFGYLVLDFSACHAAYIVLAPVQSDDDDKQAPVS
jgi:hypothetical protein